MIAQPSTTPERQAIRSVLLQVERRVRLNRRVHALMLAAGLVLLGLVSWRVLAWLGDGVPAATALVTLLATLGGIALLALFGQAVLRRPLSGARAATEADRRAGLHDELTSAYWFMQGDAGAPAAAEWIDLQLQRAARTARGLQIRRLVPLRLPRTALAGLLSGVVLLALAWSAVPLAPAQSAAHGNAGAEPDPQVRAMRELVAAMPASEATRRLEAALKALESGSSTPDERRRALAQAQDAVDQIQMGAASSREGLQRLSQMLAGQQGMEEVAEALAKGDAKRAADLLAKAQTANASAETGNAPEPSDRVGEKPQQQAMQATTDSVAEPQGGRPTAEAMKITVDRLNEIARELSAANYVNEAWQQVKGPQLQATRGANMAAGRFDQQQANGASNPSPSTGDTPMGGGTMFRSAAVAQGPGKEEQEGGTRMGDAVGESGADPLLGGAGERLEAQLKQQALTGQEEKEQDPNQAWFYSESQQRGAKTAWREVEARGRFSEAEAGNAAGISIKHRQIVKDYFMTRQQDGK
jgi:hypothetical protein